MIIKTCIMAKSKDNIVTKGFSGTIDRTLTFRQRAGKTIVGKLRRASSVAATDKMLAVRAKFKSSVAYAKKAIKNLVTKALYQAGIKVGQSAYNVAVADAFNPPKVESIQATGYHGAVGDTITVQATDDFKVATVSVSVQNAAGNLVEQGNAVMQVNELDWLYTITQANAALAGSKITATATDLPGNSASLEVTLP
jgi:hypothetical protein